MERTPKWRVKGWLRQMFLRSRERQEALKRTNYCCEKCGIKQSHSKLNKVKLDVHHIDGINVWDELIDLIYDKLLCNSDKLIPLCKECHYKEHHNE